MVLSEGTTEKIPSDTTGNGSRDRPTSSAALRYPRPLHNKEVHEYYFHVQGKRQVHTKF